MSFPPDFPAVLCKAHLIGAKLSKINLIGADLSSALLGGANLEGRNYRKQISRKLTAEERKLME